MAGKRAARLNEQFRREITSVLRTQVRDPRVGIPTVTAVEVTPDLWMARVYVRPDPTSIADPDDAGRARTDLLAGLEAAAPYIRRELSGTLTLRRIPELRFQVDESIEHAARIHALLADVLPAGGGESSSGASEGEPGAGEAGEPEAGSEAEGESAEAEADPR